MSSDLLIPVVFYGIEAGSSPWTEIPPGVSLMSGIDGVPPCYIVEESLISVIAILLEDVRPSQEWMDAIARKWPGLKWWRADISSGTPAMNSTDSS